MSSRDAYDSAPPRGDGPVYTRVYRRGGRYAHLREEDGGLIACHVWRYRVAGRDESWLGTGNQGEYDKAAGMPVCPGCFRIREAGRLGETDDPATDERYR